MHQFLSFCARFLAKQGSSRISVVRCLLFLFTVLGETESQHKHSMQKVNFFKISVALWGLPVHVFYNGTMENRPRSYTPCIKFQVFAHGPWQNRARSENTSRVFDSFVDGP
jgi:hypothetical protein